MGIAAVLILLCIGLGIAWVIDITLIRGSKHVTELKGAHLAEMLRKSPTYAKLKSRTDCEYPIKVGHSSVGCATR